jgi:hypothetical protein
VCFIVGFEDILDDCAGLYHGRSKQLDRKVVEWGLRSNMHTSHTLMFVFGSSRTGVKPFGFKVVVKGGFFWSAVAQILTL